MNAIKEYLRQQLSHFDSTALWSPVIIRDAARVLGYWAVPSFLTVIAVATFKEHVPSKYLEAAIGEGIGPHLWNVIGTLALILVGLNILMPGSKRLANAAYQVLTNTYAIGGLTLGLLCGQMAVGLAALPKSIELWRVWLLGTGGAFLVFQAMTLNFSLWYLGHLMDPQQPTNGFLQRVQAVDLRLRVVAFALFSVLPIALLFLEL
ncbi:MAG: hypothetical protein EPO09_17385 [Aquabacterium sp.]|uniref:hypothetical protein n=1 Tax=Aquabacterium sp. TaxID=1872578 RepID=UPI0012160193|nr:hypothetical protein [Aquabacterium sp.]TAK89404.1 MAG: hypothetical protein EPO09_17385 [Aquabacterium sp.]